MNSPKINLHCHTDFSDGKHSIKQMGCEAIKLGFLHIAITDHFTNSWKADVIPTLDADNKIEKYLTQITLFQNWLKNSNNHLRVYKGIEIDLSSSFDYIISNVNPNKFDIILFEYLESLEGIEFIKEIILNWKNKMLKEEQFPLLGLAHFDPSNFILFNLQQLIEFLRLYDIYFEFNSSYSQYYSQRYEEFFELIRKNNISVAIGSDAHSIRELNYLNEPYEMIRIYNLEDNLELLLKKLNSREIK